MGKQRHRRLAPPPLARCTVILGLLLAAAICPAMPTTKANHSALAAQENPAAWVDPFFAEQMGRLHVPGAVFVLVRDGQVAFANGYGMANREQGMPVDPDSSVFPAMSVSKPVTATAIMQLVEQGKVSLDADVNTYLTRFKIPDTYPQPITIAELLTHTAGFDYDVEDIGTTARGPADVLSLAEYLNTYPPARIQPPGLYELYSNADYDVLGLIVEEVSGQAFPDYAEEHIFRPLGMEHSTFRQRAPGPDRARSYRWLDGAFQPLEPHFFSNIPSAGLTTTASDMARFIQAHLQGGRGASGEHILQESTVELMHQRSFARHPDLRGMAYGFSAVQFGNHLKLWHDGWDLYRARTELAIYPNQNLGYFVAISSAGDDGGLIGALASEIDRRYGALPPLPTPPPAPADFTGRAGAFTGVYRAADFSHHTIAKAVLLRGDSSRWAYVESPGDGTLTLRFAPGAQPFVLVESSPGVFRVRGFYIPVVFFGVGDEQGGYLTWGGAEYERVPWIEQGTTQQNLGASFAGIFALAALLVPVVALVRRRGSSRSSAAGRLAGLTIWLVAALNLVFLIGFAVTLSRAYEIGLEYGFPPLLVVLLLIPLVTTALAVGLLILSVVLWFRRVSSPAGRVAVSAFTLVALAFIPFLSYWNLLRLPW